MTIRTRLACIIALSLLVGCSNDDDEPQFILDGNYLIGEWDGPLERIVYDDGTEENWESNSCIVGKSMTFFEDGGLFYVDYIEDSTGSCIDDNTTEPVASWKLNENGRLIVTAFSPDSSAIDVSPKQLEIIDDDRMHFYYQDLPSAAPENAKSYYRVFLRR